MAAIEGNEPERLSDLLPAASILIGEHAADWRDAVRRAGKALVAGGAAAPEYSDEMIATVEELGPYIVIAPGIALAHSRPSPAVHRTGLAWVTLAEPVPFGHPQNDPVRLVVGLAARDEASHVTALATLAELLSDDDRRRELESAGSPDELLRLILSYESAA